MGAALGQGGRRRDPRNAQSEDGDVLVAAGGIFNHRHHRSFNVASPTSAKIVAMIQNRMTMVDSAQPFCSKW